MISLSTAPRHAGPAALALLGCLAWQPASAQDDPAEDEAPADEAYSDDDFVSDDGGDDTDILSADTLSLILDARLVIADGEESWADGGFGKTRWDGSSDGDFKVNALPVEAALIWQPRLTSSINGLVSVVWQQDFDENVDVMEAFMTFIPPRGGNTGFSAKAGMYWPEISLEHATGGAWSTVYTITPSAINAWVGEEVKVIGAEASIFQTIGSQDVSVTLGAFGWNDTSATLLSFRGWALHDQKSTLFGHFPLPPLNNFMRFAQEDRTESIIELDKRVGFYGRVEWRPASAIVLNAFYYDNRGVPEEFNVDLQWGWRTKFWNLGLVADLGPNTRLISQGMWGTTLMGVIPANATRYWVDTRFRSAYALLTHRLGQGALSGRVELFDTREQGSRMSATDESETGWAATAAGRMPLWEHFTFFIEALHVESKRGARIRAGLPRKQVQTVFQAALRFRW